MAQRSLIIIVVAVCFSLIAHRSYATVVVDGTSGNPLAKATVLDRNGGFMGVCSDKGELPSLPLSSYPLTVRYMGYSLATVSDPGQDRILLERIAVDLPEVVVDSKRRQVLHVIGYLREYSTLTTYSDTILLFREKTVDFMIPTNKAKGYTGWFNPRVLASRSFYHFSNSKGLDSVSNHFGQHFSWSDWIGLSPKIKLPLNLRDRISATDTVYGQYSPSVIWNRSDEQADLYVDIMADKDNREYMPGVFELFNSRVEFTGFKVRYQFAGVYGDAVFADNISRMSFTIESKGRGRNMRHVLLSDGPTYVNTYAELYITDREYMTVHEASRWEKKPPSASEIGIKAPSDAPALQADISELVDRVNNFDYLGHRLVEKADTRLAGKEIPLTFQKRDRGAIKALKSIIQNNVWPPQGMQGRFRLGP